MTSGWIACWQPHENNYNTSIWNIMCGTVRFFFANPTLLDRSVLYWNYSKNFNAVVSSSPCFGSGHTAIYNSQPVPLDVQFPKLYKSIAGPPPEVDWNEAGKEVLIYGMSGSKVFFFSNAHANTWSYITYKKLQEFGTACYCFICTSVGSTIALVASFW